MTYCEMVLKYLEENGCITNGDIIRITNTNCPHSVIRDLRKKGIVLTEKTVTRNGKTFKIYFYDKPERESEVKELTPLNQLSLGLIIKKTELSALEMRQKYGM